MKDLALMDAAEIRQLRQDAGLTQQAFAEELGVSFSSIVKWERGEKTPRGLSIRALHSFRNRVRRRQRELVTTG